MATVSEVAFLPDDEIGFCPHCGLRRPLGIVNVPGMPGQRCIDCFFGGGDPEFSFYGEAIWATRDHPTIGYGQTGDIVMSWGPTYHFEPHGNFEARVPVKSEMVENRLTFPELHAVNHYQPKIRREYYYEDE